MKKSNNYFFSSILIFSIPPQVSASAFPADVVARDLNNLYLKKYGHIGIAYAARFEDQANSVIEAMNTPVSLQINPLEQFKKTTIYWGARYGINQNATTGNKILNEGAFQTGLKCGEYTASSSYRPGKAVGGIPSVCPLFRCDTLVNYLYWVGGYTLLTYTPPGKKSLLTHPKNVFNQFPYSRAPFAEQNIFEPIAHPVSHLFASEINIANLYTMDLAEFIAMMDQSDEMFSQKEIELFLSLSQDKGLSPEKRLFLLDKLGFVATIESLLAFIDMYDSVQGDVQLEHMLVRNTQAIYQKYALRENSLEKQRLLAFYIRLLNESPSPLITPIAIRGLIALGEPSLVEAHQEKIQALLENSNLEVGVNLALKTALVFKLPKLEAASIQSIIASLEQENNTQLDTFFLQAVVGRLTDNGVQSLQKESKHKISHFLASVAYKYEQNYIKEIQKDMLSSSAGVWLEASALCNADTLTQAWQYIAHHLQTKTDSQKMNYVIGFSNSPYLHKAFNQEPVLLEFKNSHTKTYQSLFPPIDTFRGKARIVRGAEFA